MIADRNIYPTKDFYKKINTAFVALENNGEKNVTPPDDLRVFATWGNNCKGYCPAREVYYHDNPSHAHELIQSRKMF